MELKQEAFAGAAHLAVVAITLRRLFQPDFETPQAIHDSLAGLNTAEPSWQQIAALAKVAQSLNAGWTSDHAIA